MYELLNYFLVVVVVVVVCYSGCNTQHLCNYFKCRLQIVSGNCGNTFCTELVSCCRWKVGNSFFFPKMALDFNYFYFILHVFVIFEWSNILISIIICIYSIRRKNLCTFHMIDLFWYYFALIHINDSVNLYIIHLCCAIHLSFSVRCWHFIKQEIRFSNACIIALIYCIFYWEFVFFQRNFYCTILLCIHYTF